VGEGVPVRGCASKLGCRVDQLRPPVEIARRRKRKKKTFGIRDPVASIRHPLQQAGPGIGKPKRIARYLALSTMYICAGSCHRDRSPVKGKRKEKRQLTVQNRNEKHHYGGIVS